MKKTTPISIIFSIPFNGMKIKDLSIAFLLFIMASPNLWSQDKHANCTHECYTEPDYTTEISVKLPYAKTESTATVDIRDGIAYYQGDIILGKLTDILQKGVAIDTDRWTNSTIHYSISSHFDNNPHLIERIHEAAAIISEKTNLCVIQRTNNEPDYVYIFPSNNGVNASTIGMSSGFNNIELYGNFSVGTAIHEFLHTVGIYHEQSREDRDNHVIIHTANIESGKEHNFDIAPIETSTDYGAYDFVSIMHYPSSAFSINWQLPTITRRSNGALITQTNELSQGDIATINSMYPIPCGDTGTTTCQSTVSTFPYSESFESGSNSWSPITANTSSCTGDWARNTNGTISSGTGPSGAAHGTHYLYTEASSPCENTTMTVESPCFDLSGLNSPTLTFDYHIYGADMGNLYLEVSTNQGSSWSTIWSQIGQQQTSNTDSWANADVALSSYTSQTVTLRFKGTTGNGYRSDMAIDNLNIQGSNSCPFTAGTSCDDNDICTINDVYDNNCNCIGTVQDTDNDGLCDANDTCPTDPNNTCNALIAYCSSQGNPTYEFIESVQIGSITNTSGNDNGYGNYTANEPFNIGNFDTPITLTPGFTGDAYDENWKIWVDINKDGDFEDAGEEVFSGTSIRNNPLSGTIKVPSASGVTTMRIAMIWNVAATPCNIIESGEFEDYTVNLSTVSSKSASTSTLVEVYPNPAKHYINADIHDIISGSNTQSVDALIYNMKGQLIHTETLDATGVLTINTQHLPEAPYILRLQTDDGRAFTGKFLKL